MATSLVAYEYFQQGVVAYERRQEQRLRWRRKLEINLPTLGVAEADRNGFST
eukprot:SAG11_NODE_33677_length_276_cov_0.570621_2_plen_52_part_00